jgi:hypothetical protein
VEYVDDEGFRVLLVGGMIVVMTMIILIVIVGVGRVEAKSWTVTYSNGCKEVFVEGNLTTPMCLAGRFLSYREEWNESDFFVPFEVNRSIHQACWELVLLNN